MRFALFALVLSVSPAFAQAEAEADVVAVTSARAPVSAEVESAPAFYVTAERAVVRTEPSATSTPLATLRRRDGLRVLADSADGWRLVQYGTARGFVRAEELSNVWIRVDKSERTTYIYRGADLLRVLPADVSASPEDKVRRSALGEREHYRIPEGTFFVTRLNDESEYYRAFVLSYPGPVHALRGLEAGIIGQQEYEAILRADQEAREPPMGTRLGGLIEIHGQGSGRQQAWTRGCVALRNVHMDELWDVVEVGTPVVIEP